MGKRNINWKLRRLLADKGLSQRELAFRIGCPEARLSEIINGWSEPAPELRQLIAAELSVQAEELFGGEFSA